MKTTWDNQFKRFQTIFALYLATLESTDVILDINQIESESIKDSRTDISVRIIMEMRRCSDALMATIMPWVHEQLDHYFENKLEDDKVAMLKSIDGFNMHDIFYYSKMYDEFLEYLEKNLKMPDRNTKLYRWFESLVSSNHHLLDCIRRAIAERGISEK
jgi:hypothetical protein